MLYFHYYADHSTRCKPEIFIVCVSQKFSNVNQIRYAKFPIDRNILHFSSSLQRAMQYLEYLFFVPTTIHITKDSFKCYQLKLWTAKVVLKINSLER